MARVPVLFVLALAALAAVIVPRRVEVRPDAPGWRWGAAALLVAAAALVTATSADYGYSVDEHFQSRLGIALADWYARLLSGDPPGAFVAEYEPMNHYGGLFELFAELASRLSPLERTETRHWITALFGVAGLGAAYLLGVTLHSRAAGFVSVLLLLLTPRFYGQLFNNSKDVPFAVCMTCALVALCRALPHLPRLSLARTAGLGLALGAAMGIRVGGVIVLGYLGLALAWWLIGGKRVSRGDLLRLAGLALAVSGLAWGVMLAFWPWGMAAPLRHPLQALGYFGDIVQQQHIDFDVFFEGRDYTLSTLPRRFTLVFLLISMPEFALVAPLLVVPLVRRLPRLRPWWPGARGMARLLTGAAIVVPLLTTASRGIIQYDSARHFLFVLPPLTVLFAVGLVATLAGPARTGLKVALLTATVGLSGLTVLDMWALHPYQYVYFNRSVAGGLRAASERFETDYLGLSYREGARWLLEHYVHAEDRPTRVGICPGFFPNLEDGMRTDVVRARRFRPAPPAEAEVALVSTRAHCREQYAGPALAVVERLGTPLVYVIRVEGFSWTGTRRP